MSSAAVVIGALRVQLCHQYRCLRGVFIQLRQLKSAIYIICSRALLKDIEKRQDDGSPSCLPKSLGHFSLASNEEPW